MLIALIRHLTRDKQVKRNLFSTIFILVILALVFWQARLFDFSSQEKKFVVESIRQEINTPPPLRGPSEDKGTILSSREVIEWTNIYRGENSLGSLSINTRLNKSAFIKAQDMLNRQYFAHNSPSGEGVADLVKDAGYEFILVGENLALGNFENEKELLRAWMNSPGHRENILNTSYLEIGVGVVQGTFEGKTTWIAVQHFGKPRSACPLFPSETLFEQIEKNKQSLAIIEVELDAKESEIKALDQRSPQYNEKANEYNELAGKYNALTEETKNLVDMYNTQVQAFNACAAS